MHRGKKILIGLISLLIFITITNGLVLTAFATVATDREQIKLVLANKAMHSVVTKALINNQQSTNASAPEQSIDNEALKKIIDKYVTTEAYNKAVDNVVDSTYSWLEGETEQPKFNIAFASSEAEFQKFITQVFTDRFNSLPLCAEAVDVTVYNPLEASCRSEDYTAADVQTFISDQANTPELAGFYKNASLNSNLVFGEIDPQTTNQFRGYYNLLKLLPFAVWGIVISLNAFVIFVAMNWRRGVRIASIATLAPSLLVLVSAALFGVFFTALMQALLQEDGVLTIAEISSILRPFMRAVSNRIIFYSLILSGFSIVALLGSIFIGKDKPSLENDTTKNLLDASSTQTPTRGQKP